MLNNIEKQKEKSRDFIPHRGVSVDTIRWACFITQIIFEKKKNNNVFIHVKVTNANRVNGTIGVNALLSFGCHGRSVNKRETC